MEFFCLTLSHHEASVDIREQLSLTPERCLQAHQWNSQTATLPSLIILSTCNRTEFYGTLPHSSNHHTASHSSPSDPRDLIHTLYQALDRPCPHATQRLLLLTGRAAAEHLFRVASGLESMIVGETEIFGQVKQAYAQATAHGRVEKLLHRLFQTAFRAGKKVREETDITRGAVSVGASAAELAQHLFGNLQTRRALLLGAGDTAEKCARALLTRGLENLCVANRTLAHAETLATSLERARPIPLDLWREELLQSDIIITAIHSETPIIRSTDHATLLQHRRDPLFFIDLALPRNIDPAFGLIDDIFLYNLDDLQLIAERNLAERHAAITQGELIIHRHANDFMDWLHHLPHKEAALPDTTQERDSHRENSAPVGNR